jgi:hypothetical protein
MKRLLGLLFGLQLAFAADPFIKPEASELRSAQAKIRLHMVEHLCQLMMWGGIEKAHAECKVVFNKQVGPAINFRKLKEEIQVARAKDPTLEPEVRNGFIKKIANYFQGEIAALQNVNIDEMIEDGEQEKAWALLMNFNREFHKKWRTIEKAMGTAVPMEARMEFLKGESLSPETAAEPEPSDDPPSTRTHSKQSTRTKPKYEREENPYRDSILKGN